MMRKSDETGDTREVTAIGRYRKLQTLENSEFSEIYVTY